MWSNHLIRKYIKRSATKMINIYNQTISFIRWSVCSNFGPTLYNRWIQMRMPPRIRVSIWGFNHLLWWSISWSWIWKYCKRWENSIWFIQVPIGWCQCITSHTRHNNHQCLITLCSLAMVYVSPIIVIYTWITFHLKSEHVNAPHKF